MIKFKRFQPCGLQKWMISGEKETYASKVLKSIMTGVVNRVKLVTFISKFVSVSLSLGQKNC